MGIGDIRWLGGGQPRGNDERAPLVLLHGLSFDRRQWLPMLSEWRVDPGRRVLAVDLPGHGGSPGCVDNGLAEVARAVTGRWSTPASTRPWWWATRSVGRWRRCTAPPIRRGAWSMWISRCWSAGSGRCCARSNRCCAARTTGGYGSPCWTGCGIDLLPAGARRSWSSRPARPAQDLLLGYWREVLTEPAEAHTERRIRDLAAIRARGVAYHYVTGAEPDPAYLRWLTDALPDLAVTVLPDSGHFPHLAHPLEFAKILAG